MKRLARAWRPAYRAAEHRASRVRAASALGRLLFCCLVSAQAIAGPYEDGIAAYDRGEYAAALSLWLPLAEHGNVSAQYNVAVLYEKGQGVAQDYREAARWYLKAAEQGDPEAQYSIGVLYEKGLGGPQDPERAQQWYASVIVNGRAGDAASSLRERARQRFASLDRAREERVPFDGGRFVIGGTHGDTCVIALQGAINRAATLKFDDVVAKSAARLCARPWLLLESPGGIVDDGLSLAREVRVREFRTMTRLGCASACALIFMAGTERVLIGSRATIGLHQPATSTVGVENSRRCVTTPYSDGLAQIRRFLRWAMPSEADRVMEIILQTPCDSIEWIRGPRAVELGIATRIESSDVDLVGLARQKR